jgi:SAM-dependent methyltransferase
VDEYLKNNRDLWDEITPIHARSEFYDLEGFKTGKSTLVCPIEVEEMGDVSGKSLLHLQCHFGMDTLFWARRGAKTTGIDFSEKAIDLARSLSEELGIESKFVRSDIYDLPKNLDGEFDIVYTSGGVLCWLPDLKRWGEIIAHFLKPGGFFYILEGHPFGGVFDDSPGVTEPKVTHSYFHEPEPTKWEPECDYTSPAKGSIKWIDEDPDAAVTHGSYEWTHSLSDIINALIGAELKIEFLHEYPEIFYKSLPFMESNDGRTWRIEGDKLPLIFTLKATKP